jgi:hypothetical protein
MTVSTGRITALVMIALGTGLAVWPYPPYVREQIDVYIIDDLVLIVLNIIVIGLAILAVALSSTTWTWNEGKQKKRIWR